MREAEKFISTIEICVRNDYPQNKGAILSADLLLAPTDADRIEILQEALDDFIDIDGYLELKKLWIDE